uniref:Uncharacterized protein n=1 Tax=Anopheles culicifacies TaxID=139723 RepID=A0A182MQV5_9DIPT
MRIGFLEKTGTSILGAYADEPARAQPCLAELDLDPVRLIGDGGEGPTLGPITGIEFTVAPAVDRDHFYAAQSFGTRPCSVEMHYAHWLATMSRIIVVVIVTVGYTGESNVAVGLDEHLLSATSLIWWIAVVGVAVRCW